MFAILLEHTPAFSIMLGNRLDGIEVVLIAANMLGLLDLSQVCVDQKLHIGIRSVNTGPLPTSAAHGTHADLPCVGALQHANAGHVHDAFASCA